MVSSSNEKVTCADSTAISTTTTNTTTTTTATTATNVATTTSNDCNPVTCTDTTTTAATLTTLTLPTRLTTRIITTTTTTTATTTALAVAGQRHSVIQNVQLPPQTHAATTSLTQSKESNSAPATDKDATDAALPAGPQVPNTNVPIHPDSLYNCNRYNAPQVTSQSNAVEYCVNAGSSAPCIKIGDQQQQQHHNNNNHDYVNFNKCSVDALTLVEQPKSCAHVAAIVPQFKTNGVVLNVPQVSNLQPIAVDDKRSPCARPKVSKLDLAAKKRRQRRDMRVAKSIKTRRTAVPGGGATPPRQSDEARYTFEFGVRVYGYSSESSSDDDGVSTESDSDADQDVWIRSGPPLLSDANHDKVEFMAVFGLITHRQRNEVEFKKLERRKWSALRLIGSGEVDDGYVAARTDKLDLPVPFKSPSSFNRSLDYLRKSGFLFCLGLKSVLAQQRHELEKNWMQVVRQRIKRKSLLDHNDFYLRFYDSLNAIKLDELPEKERILLTVPRFNESRVTDTPPSAAFPVRQVPQRSCENTTSTTTTNVLSTIPHATLFKRHATVIGNEAKLVVLNGVVLKQPLYIEPNNILHAIPPPDMQQPDLKMSTARQCHDLSSSTTLASFHDAPKDTRLTWPGVEEIMACYTRYSKEREVEIASLKRKCGAQRQIAYQQQADAERLQTRHSELMQTTAETNQKRLKLEESIDRLTKIVQDLKSFSR